MSPQKALHDYTRHRRSLRIKLVLFLIALLACSWLSLSVSASGLHLLDPWLVLVGSANKASTIVMTNIRLPRLAAALVVGAALALAGCVMQNVLRNPLASSSTLGVSQGAAFGAAFAIVFFEAGVSMDGNVGSAVSVTSPYLVSACAFIAGIASALVILGLAAIAHVSAVTMILSGVALGAMFTGATAVIQYFADDIKVASVVYWTFGDLGRVSWQQLGIMAAVTLAVFVYFQRNAWNYNGLESGLQSAVGLGIHVNRLMVNTMLAAALVASVSVACVGTIGFIGLIAPHVARRFIGGNHTYLLAASALTGACLLAAAEIAARVVVPPAILPIGALTSFLGAPVFLYMIFKHRGAPW